MNNTAPNANRHDDQPAVSVVVPVYNVENYLDRCMNSLVAQTLENIEIILVDDGSTDNSAAMCDAWAKKDGRIRVIHKENGGLSDARNVGVGLARANWIGFVDSDDYVSTEMYAILYENAMNYEAEISIGGVIDEHDDSPVADSDLETVTNPMQRSFTGVEALRKILIAEDAIVGIPPKLYARQLLLEYPMPKGRTYEDAFVVADYFTHVQTAVIDLRPLYHYVHHAGTITTQPFTPSALDVIDAYRHVYAIVMQKCPQLKTEAMFRLYWAHFKVLDKMLLTRGINKCAEQKEVVAFLRDHYKDILANPHIGQNRKLAMRILRHSVHAYLPFAAANELDRQQSQ